MTLPFVFVDTSAWWAYFHRDDQWHHRAVAAMRTLLESRAVLVTTDHVFDEVVTGLLGRAGHRIAAQAGTGILKSPSVLLVFVDEPTFREAWRVFEKHDRMGWSPTDCISMGVMRKREIRRAFSFDTDFEKMGFDLFPGDDES